MRPGFKAISICILISILLLFPGCSGKNKNSAAQKPQMSSGQKPTAPQEMKTIQADLDKIISDLTQKIMSEQASSLQKNTQLTTQGEGQQGGQQSQGQQGKQGQSDQGQSQQQGQQKSSSGSQAGAQAWQTEDTGVKDIHTNWNKMEPEAVKAGLSVTARDKFEQALEKLTMAAGQQKKEESLQAAIDLYGQYSELVRLFNMSTPPEFYQTKYEIMNAVFKAWQSDWTTAKAGIPKIQENWRHLKVQAQNIDEKLMNQTEFSIHDLEQAIQTQKIDIVLIKTDIVMKNLQQLEKKLSSKTSGK